MQNQIVDYNWMGADMQQTTRLFKDNEGHRDFLTRPTGLRSMLLRHDAGNVLVRLLRVKSAITARILAQHT